MLDYGISKGGGLSSVRLKHSARKHMSEMCVKEHTSLRGYWQADHLHVHDLLLRHGDRHLDDLLDDAILLDDGRHLHDFPLRKEVIHERLNLFMRAEPCYCYYHH